MIRKELGGGIRGLLASVSSPLTLYPRGVYYRIPWRRARQRKKMSPIKRKKTFTVAALDELAWLRVGSLEVYDLGFSTSADPIFCQYGYRNRPSELEKATSVGGFEGQKGAW